MTTYIIVGAGVFGTSTAYHLKKQCPDVSIILIDRSQPPCPVAASHDINKIVRADYEDLFYCSLALKTLHTWKTDPFFKQWFHHSGLLTITDKDSSLIETIIENFKKLNVEYKPEKLKPQEIAFKFDGIFSDMNLRPDDKLLFNGLAGIAEAEKALGATIEACIDLGVRYVADPVSRLLIEGRACNGVKTLSGKTITAANIILCTGANTAKLIADSAPDRHELHAGARITARAVCTAAVELNTRQQKEFGKVPAVVHHSGKDQAETMPPVDGLLKFISEYSFKHTVLHKESGQYLSVPFTDTAKSQWTAPDNIPPVLRERLHRSVKHIYGSKAAELDFKTFRICWDGITPDDDWFISPHPHCENLYIATAGTFHGWKFLPIVGEYVVQMLQGTLDKEMIERWSWDRPLELPKPTPHRPDTEWRDFETTGASKI